MKKIFSICKEKGQALVFYALLVPVAFCFVGAAIEFGWWYFNESRLQNAADAAVLAGASMLVFDEKNLSDYTYTTFITNNDSDLKKLIDDGVISTRSTSDGDNEALKYIKKNMSKDDTLTDKLNENAAINFVHILYGSDKSDYDALYYQITLSEKASHLFVITKQFGDLDIKAVSTVKITHVIERPDDPFADYEHGPSLYEQMKALRNKVNYATWDHIKKEYDRLDKKDYSYLGVSDSSNAARTRSVQAKGNEYVEGNFYRTETLTLHGWSIASTGQGNTTGGKMDQRNLDNLFVDFKVDVNKKFDKDWDLGTTPPSGTSFETVYNLGVDNKKISPTDRPDVFELRIHDLINVGKWNASDSKYTYEYKVRPDKEPPDPLYVYIENENNYSHEHQGSGTTGFNTVRQIIINVNVANTDEQTDRPMFFFYDGPEKIDGKSTNTWNEDWRESWKDPDRYKNNPRNSLPVIINLNADFRGVFFMPNSPVVINGNGHNFEGFVVAMEYKKLKTAADFPEETEFDGVTCQKVIDEKGNVIYKNGEETKYTYTLITQEKSNIIKTFVSSEQEYITVNPMFIDQKGNVQYADEPVTPQHDWNDDENSRPLDPTLNDGEEGKVFYASDFGLSTSKYNSFNKVRLVNYKYLDNRSADNIYLSIRSDIVD